MVFAGYPKYYEVKQGSRHGEPAVSAALDKIGDEHNPIYDAQHLHFYGYDKHQQYLHFRESSRKSQENGHIYIISTKQRGNCGKEYAGAICHHICRPDQIAIAHHQKAADNGKQHTGKNIYIITVGSPCPFQ